MTSFTPAVGLVVLSEEQPDGRTLRTLTTLKILEGENEHDVDVLTSLAILRAGHVQEVEFGGGAAPFLRVTAIHEVCPSVADALEITR